MSVKALPKRRKIPMIVSRVDVTPEHDKSMPRSVFLHIHGSVYPALAYRLGFVYSDEHGINRFYIRRIAGVNHLYYNEARISTSMINGGIEGLVSNGYTALMKVNMPRGHGSTVLKALIAINRRGHYNSIEYLSIGTFKRKKLNIVDADIAISGSKLIALAKTSRVDTGEAGPSIMLVFRRDGGLESRYTLSNAIFGGYNGEWAAVWEIDHNKKQVILHVFDYGSYRKHALPLSLISGEYLAPNTVVDYNGRTLIVASKHNVAAYDLKNKSLVWSKGFPEIRHVCAGRRGASNRTIGVVSRDKFYLLAYDYGTKRREISVEEAIVCGIDDRYIGIGTGGPKLKSGLVLYNWKGMYLGSYYFDELVNGITIVGDYILVGYLSSTGSPKAVLADMSEALEVELADIEMFSGEERRIEVKQITPTVEQIWATDNNIRVGNIGTSIIIRDLGARPGRHTVVLLIRTNGFLDLKEGINILIKKPESLFSRIGVASKPSQDKLGFFIPVVLESAISIDTLRITIWSNDNSVYATTHELNNLKPGAYEIPVRILWCEAGIHSVNIEIKAYSRGRLYSEKLPGKILIERDVLDPVLRVMGTTAYVWSPIKLGDARLVFSGEGIEKSLMTSLKRGWNTFDVEGFIPEKVTIVTRGRTVVEAYRRIE